MSSQIVWCFVQIAGKEMEKRVACSFLWGLATLCIGLLSSEIAYGQDLATKKAYGSGNGDFVVGPDYRLDPDLSDRGNPKGKQFEFRMSLAESKIFPGTDATLDSKKEVRKERK
ncbi:MAG: hypothetical protein ACKOOI_18005, partial [Pirellula sp.]